VTQNLASRSAFAKRYCRIASSILSSCFRVRQARKGLGRPIGNKHGRSLFDFATAADGQGIDNIVYVSSHDHFLSFLTRLRCASNR
jgi:hypothetical protein